MNRLEIHIARAATAIALSVGLLQGGCDTCKCDPCHRPPPPCCPPPVYQAAAAEVRSLPTFPFTHWRLDDDTYTTTAVKSEVEATEATISLMNENMTFIGSLNNGNKICSPAVPNTCTSFWPYNRTMTVYDYSGGYFVRLNLAVTVGGTTGPSLPTGNLGVHMNGQDLPLAGAEFVIYSAKVTDSTKGEYVIYHRLKYYPSTVILGTPVWNHTDPDYKKWDMSTLPIPP